MLTKVQPGDPLKISAGTFNTSIDAARDFQQRQRAQQQRPRSSFTDHGVVLVRNDSGAGRDRLNVLGISGVVIDLIVNPDRPGRVEPRVLKRRPKQYSRMTHPRPEYRKALLNQQDAA